MEDFDKKILFVVPTLTGGGAERVVSILSSELAGNGSDVSILLNERCDNEYFVKNEVKIYTIPENVHKQQGIIGKIERIRSRYLITKQINPDITITFLNDAIQFLCNIPLRGKFISTVRLNPKSGNKVSRILKYIIVGLSDACLVQNNEQKNYFNKKIQRKIYILPNPIEKESFAEKIEIKDNMKKIITLGRLTKQKNQAMLIKAFKMALVEKNDLILEIYGQGEERIILENLICELNLQNHVFLKGRTTNTKEKLMESDLFILSSDCEGMPNALLEAMAAGVPSISTDCPTGPSDIIRNEEHGILVEVNNADEMSRAILRMQSLEYRRKVSANAYNYVKNHYSVDIVVKKLSETLDQIMKE